MQNHTPSATPVPANSFKVGVFASNVWGGLTQTTAPERWDASWPANKALAQQADAAGVDFLLPLGSWLGLNGAADTDGHSYETLTWAAGLLACTQRITVFATVHVSFFNPVLAAKQIVTCQHIGGGRFGLNIVSGSKKSEFDAFGVELLPHDDRYVYAEEWLDVVERIWRQEGPFDVDGTYFTMRGVQGHPGPLAGQAPTLVSAGASAAGRRFAASRADASFVVILSEDEIADTITELRTTAGRPMDVFGSSHMFCRPTRKEAEEYYHHLVHENGDWDAADTLLHEVFPHSESIPADRLEGMRERFCSGHGTYPLIGSPDDIAAALVRLREAGLDGIAIALPNYLTDFPLLRDEILPRLEAAGIRAIPKEQARSDNLSTPAAQRLVGGLPVGS